MFVLDDPEEYTPDLWPLMSRLWREKVAPAIRDSLEHAVAIQTAKRPSKAATQAMTECPMWNSAAALNQETNMSKIATGNGLGPVRPATPMGEAYPTMLDEKRPPAAVLPVGNRLAVLRDTPAQQTKNGLWLPTQGQQPMNSGVVYMVGGDLKVTPAPEPGDRVIFSRFAGQEIKVGDDTYLIITENDVLCILP